MADTTLFHLSLLGWVGVLVGAGALYVSLSPRYRLDCHIPLMVKRYTDEKIRQHA